VLLHSSLSHCSFERRREKEYTFIIRMVIFVRDFYPKRKEDLVCVVREQSVQREKKKKKEKFRRQKEQLLSFQARFFALKRLCFITRAEAHIYINE
jgi:hypothetical protein